MKLLCIGKIKNKDYENLINMYLAKINKYQKLEVIEIPIKGEDPSLEGDKLLDKIKPNDYVVLLDREGKELDSLELASYIKDMLIKNSNITFIIGGSLGVSKKIKERADLILSFSKMTYPHELFRLIFMESIYRSFKINNNERYHK